MPRRKPSNIDIFLVKDIPFNCSCYTINDLTSNHLPVIMKFDQVNITRNNMVLNKTDWQQFFGGTDKWRIDHRLHDTGSIDKCIDNLQKFIIKVFKRSSAYQSRKRCVVISDEEDRAAIDRLIKLRNYYRRKYQRSAKNRYKIFKNVLNNHIKAALIEGRNKYWANKLKILNTKDRSLWNTLKTLQRKKIPPPPFVLEDQTIIYEPLQKAEALANNFHSVYTQAATLTSPFTPVVNDYIKCLKNMIPPINSDNNFLTPYSILNILKHMANNKAPGLDKVTTIMLKNSSFKIILQVYYIIRSSMQLGYFPNIWKTALVLAFPKPGKPPTSPANYRPISLLSILSKIYEKLIHMRIMKYLEENNVIIDEQFGFRPRHSTIAQLLRITECFALEINKKRFSAIVLLDLQKALTQFGIKRFCTNCM